MTDDNAAGAAPADETAEVNETDAVEAKAREQGWRPKEEWTGKPENWKPADVYVEHGDLKSRLAKQEDTIARLKRTTEAAIERQKKTYEDQIATLKAQKQAAVKAGNVEAVEKLDDKIEEIKVAAKSDDEPKASADEEDKAEVVADWQLGNSWFESDEDMTKYAVRISQGYNEKNPKASMKDNLAYVDKKMREKFPDYEWSKKAAPTERKTGANGHAPVDGGGFGGSRKSGPTADDLPPEAKEIGAKLVEQKLYKHIGEYAKEYWKNA